MTWILELIRPQRQALTGVVVGILLAGVVVPLATGREADRTTVHASARSTSGDQGPVATAAPALEDADSGAPASRPTTVSGAARRADAGGGSSEAAVAGAPVVRGVDRAAGTIKVGAIIIDIAQGAAVGFAVPNLSVDDIKKMFDAYIADLNERGGIDGLKVEPVYVTYSDAAGERAACLALTEDNAVYDVMDTGTLSSPTVLCLTQEHGQLTTIGGNTGIQGSVYDRAGGLLFSAQAAGQRSVRDASQVYADKGMLKGKTIGIVGDDAIDPGGEVTDALEHKLRELGAKIGYRSRFSANADTAASQAPLEVAQQRQHGVDTVILAARVFEVGTRFVQAAESSGWRPTYLTTDWAGYFCDTCVQLMPPSFAGAKIFTHMANPLKNRGLPEPDVQHRCRQVYEKQTGESINWRGVGLEGDAYVVMLLVCGEMTMFEKGAKASLPTLAYDAFVRGLEGIGQVWIPPVGPGRLAPGKHDNADLMLEATYATDCKCWRADSTGFEYGPKG